MITPLNAQVTGADLIDIDDDDLNIGADIFSDYNEDVEAVQIMEDERFFRYGRFFTFSIGVGNTGFTGNRGSVTQNEPPTFSLQLSYFLNFRVSYQIGIEHSKHNMLFNGPVNGSGSSIPGLVEVNMTRPYFGLRYHIDTSDLGTALTYSNPYLTSRIEYWYQKNKFINQPNLTDQQGGGLGFGFGGGLEFPIVLKEYYIGVEFLYHVVNYFDKYTQFFRESTTNTGSQENVEDLTGNAVSFMVSYVINW